MNIIGTRLQVMRGTAKQTSGGLMKKDLIYNKYNKIVSKKISMKYSKKFGKIMKGGGKRFGIKDFKPINTTKPNLPSIDMKEIEINFDNPNSPIKIYNSKKRLIRQTKNYSVSTSNITVKCNNMSYKITLNDEDIKKNLNNKIKAIHKQVNQSFKKKGYETIYRLSSYTLLNNNSNNKEVKSNSNTLYFASIKREEGKKKVCILSINNTNITKIKVEEEIEFDEIKHPSNNSKLHNTKESKYRHNNNYNILKNVILKNEGEEVCILEFDTEPNKSNFIKNTKNTNMFPGIYELL